jgi:hypothetical protein
MRKTATILWCLVCVTPCVAQDLPETLPRVPFHLTARPWKPLGISREAYLDSIEGVCRFTVKHLGPDGEVIDPFLKREHQYSTPYFAFAAGTLVHAGRAKDLLPQGVAAMDHATACLAKGAAGIPDNHGEFFIPCLAGALEVYEGLVPAEKLEQWRGRMRLPVEKIVRGQTNNWRAYAMRGEWMRAKAGLVDRERAVAYVEDGWKNATQRERIAGDKWNLYQDHQTDPESHAVEAVGRGNLLGLIAQGYDGPSAGEMRELVERGTAVSLLLQDPTGQCAPDGRADDHVFNDVVYQLCFDVMAERAHVAGEQPLAGQYRRAAMLAFKSKERWRRSDGDWAGSYFITKNRFDSSQRVGYQTASNIGNYNGAVMLHLAEAYLARATDIPEQPAPCEIGGYAFATDAKFASAVADAGGMQMFAALRGDTKLVYDHYWTSLGVNRFSRVDWDSRLGPSDGVRDAASGRGVTFAPTWMEDGEWVRLADVPDRYEGKFSVQFAHPLLVRCAIDYAPIAGKSDPHFSHEFLITPDGVLATLRSDDAKEFGVTWPILENDGTALSTHVKDGVATTAYDDDGDQQCFLAVGDREMRLDATDDPLQSTYGWLRPLRATCAGRLNRTFIYPRSAADLPADQMRASIRITDDGFDSRIAAVHGTLYRGRTSAGGEGDRIDIGGDGKPDATFDAPCRFILQLRDGKIVAAEADRKVKLTFGGREIPLEAYVPVSGLGG